MSAQRGRRPGFVMSDEHRTKIANSKLLSRLIACAEGEVEMTSTQASVALGLLKKVMPDLSAQTVEHSGPDGEAIQLENVSDLEAARRLLFIVSRAERSKD
jgi:two-component SAPR family response regulator